MKEIIEAAVYLDSESSREENDNVKAYHRLATPVEITGAKVIVESIIIERTSRDLFYDFNLTDIVNPAGSSSGDIGETGNILQPSAGFTHTLLQNTLSFNENEDNGEMLKTPVSPSSNIQDVLLSEQQRANAETCVTDKNTTSGADVKDSGETLKMARPDGKLLAPNDEPLNILPELPALVRMLNFKNSLAIEKPIKNVKDF